MAPEQAVQNQTNNLKRCHLSLVYVLGYVVFLVFSYSLINNLILPVYVKIEHCPNSPIDCMDFVVMSLPYSTASIFFNSVVSLM